ncbi:Putative GATA zinc finger [Rhizopus microsporus]|nr:Putative GATA zinc finger [Rhizopus microsporus]
MMEALTPVKSPTLPKKMETVSATECANCGTTTTPLWRRGPNGETICNACGLYLKARNTLRPPSLKRTNKKEKAANDCGGGTCPGGGQCNGTGGSSSCAGCPAFNQHQVNRQALICANCRTTTTPLWRRDEAGNTICNACGLYYKLHNVHRPVSMKRSVIKRRKRIIITQGSDAEEDDDNQSNIPEDENNNIKRFKKNAEVPEIEDYVVKKKTPTDTNIDRINFTPPMEDTHRDTASTLLPFEQLRNQEFNNNNNNNNNNNMDRNSSLLPPISSERKSYKLESLFHREPSTNALPSISLPPLSSSPPLPPSSTPQQNISQQHQQQHRLTMSLSPPLPPSIHRQPLSVRSPSPMEQRGYELAEFDMALDKLEHLRRQVRPEQAYALSQLTNALTDLATKAEVILSLDSLSYSQ